MRRNRAATQLIETSSAKLLETAEEEDGRYDCQSQNDVHLACS